MPAEPSETGHLQGVPDDPEYPATTPRPSTDTRLLPRSVTVALTVVAAEVVILVLGLAFLVSTLLQDAETDLRLTIATLVFASLMIVALVFGGFAVLRGRRWGRAPLITWQLLQVLVSYPALAEGRLLAYLLTALSGVGLVSLLLPGTTRHLSEHTAA